MKFPQASSRIRIVLRASVQVSVACSLTILLSSCVDKEKEAALTKEVQEKSNQFEKLKRDLISANEELKKVTNEVSDLKNATRNLQRYQKQELEVTKEFNDLKKYVDEVNATNDFLNGSLEAWRKAARASMIGLPVGSVELGGGKVILDATVVEVKGDLVRFSHEGTQTEAKLADLPTPLRERLGDESLVLQNLQIDSTQK